MADIQQIYFTTLTAVGEAKDAKAKALGTPIKFTAMAVGDGNGALPVPDRTRTALVREVRRAAINTLKADPKNPAQLIAEQVIPEDEGGWWIRELGLYDEAGDLFAIANCPETYKPVLAQGSGRTQVVRMVLIMSSAPSVTLKVDPSVVLATRSYVDEQDALHAAAADPHPQYLTEAEGAARIQAAVSALVAAAPAALDTLAELATALGNDKNFAATITNALALKAPKDSPAFTGNVGVGTNAPAYKLHVNGRLGLGVLGTPGQNALTINPDTPGNSVFHLKAGSGGDALTISTGSDAYGSNDRLKLDGLGGLWVSGDAAISGAASIIKVPSQGAYNDIARAGDALYKGTSESVPVVLAMHNGSAIRCNASSLQFRTANSFSEQMTLDAAGNLLVGTPAGICHTLSKGPTADTFVLNVAYSSLFYVGDGYNYNASHATVKMLSRLDTGRSINAAGTINASGADYAEYMAKADGCGVISKGQVVGIDTDGKITDKYADAVSFLVKSTNPSYVGGDTWGTEEAIGMLRPIEPVFEEPIYAGPEMPQEPAPVAQPPVLGTKATDKEKALYSAALLAYERYPADLATYQADQVTYDAAQKAHATEVQAARHQFDTVALPAYLAKLADFEAKLEAARQKVDRLAYCGQVPVNVTGATPGQYVVPVQDGEGIAGHLVDANAITFDQYRRAVGIVQNVLEDGRANVRVKPV